LELDNGTRRRKVDNGLNLHGINHNIILGYNETKKSPRHHTKNAFMCVQMNIIVATLGENGLQVTRVILVSLGMNSQII
jgi:hypothetical protein